MGDVLLKQLSDYLGNGYPRGLRGKTLLTVADFNSTHSGSLFTSYAFLTIDLDRNSEWFAAQRSFRSHVLRKRRMSYKTLNDAARRRALPSFLPMSDLLVGALTIVIIPRDFGPLLQGEGQGRDDLLGLWKPHVHEHLLRATHLGSIITAYLSSPGQAVLFITDQDEIASNTAQLTQLTEIVGRTIGNSVNHSLGHLRAGTTYSDDGSLALEDLAAIADLSAGAMCDVMSSMAHEGYAPRHRKITPFPGRVTANRN